MRVPGGESCLTGWQWVGRAWEGLIPQYQHSCSLSFADGVYQHQSCESRGQQQSHTKQSPLLRICLLQSWSKAFRASKKKKGGKAAPTEQQQHPQLDQAAQSMSRLQQSLGDLLAELRDGAHQLLQQPEDAAVAAVLAEFDESSDAALRVLVGWEQRVSVQLVLTQLVKQQRALLTQVKDSSSGLHKRLHGVSW